MNDLPGALIHLRGALAPGGLLIAQFMGAGCLPHLRAAMLAADADRPAPRLHPMVDVRAGGQLLQRAGLADPVIDYRTLSVSFGSFDRLIGDLRAQGLSNVLASPGPALGKAALARARAAFGDGRVTERFEILSLSGDLGPTPITSFPISLKRRNKGEKSESPVARTNQLTSFRCKAYSIASTIN